MYKSADLNRDPRNGYKVSVIFDSRIHVLYQKTGKVIYNGEIPKIIQDLKGSKVSKNSNEIFYDREILDFFIHEIKPEETYRIMVLEIGHGDGDIARCSGRMELSEQKFHKLNIERIGGLDILTHPTRGQIALRYVDNFIKKEELQENPEKMPDFKKKPINWLNKGPKVPRNVKKWAIKEAIKMMNVVAENKEMNARGGRTKSYI